MLLTRGHRFGLEFSWIFHRDERAVCLLSAQSTQSAKLGTKTMASVFSLTLQTVHFGWSKERVRGAPY
jgi:hypothetical protein